MKIGEPVEITGTLKNVVRERHPIGDVLWGNIYGDVKGRFPDGHFVRTSLVQHFDGDVVYTRNSTYKIEGTITGA